MLDKRLEKAYRKSFATGNPFPTFAFYGYREETDGSIEVQKRPRLTLYGEINQQELFVSTAKKEEQELVLNEQERIQMAQAETRVIEENLHKEQNNRFKDLHEQYSKTFLYQSHMAEVYIKCRSSYLPLEARIDRDSFEQLLVKTKPKNLVLVNGYSTKCEQIRRFCENNKVDINVQRADQYLGSLKFCTNAGVKQVFIENQLLNSLALQKIHKNFSVSRIIGEIRPQVER